MGRNLQGGNDEGSRGRHSSPQDGTQLACTVSLRGARRTAVTPPHTHTHTYYNALASQDPVCSLVVLADGDSRSEREQVDTAVRKHDGREGDLFSYIIDE